MHNIHTPTVFPVESRMYLVLYLAQYRYTKPYAASMSSFRLPFVKS